jgi:pyruvate dehydrogenase E1 component
MPFISKSYIDSDPTETTEWLEALDSVVRYSSSDRATFLVEKLVNLSRQSNLPIPLIWNTPYFNTLSANEEPLFPGDEKIEFRLTAIMRWNALIMVLRASKQDPSLGGHLASYASSATLYEVGFQHFFRASDKKNAGDLVFIQGHSAPGIYARALLEGRLTTEQLDHFRQEIGQQGLSAYPHPHLMPNFWQFPTVSMGLGILQAIYHARLIKYMENRGLCPKLNIVESRKVWFFAGDGEMDEPESVGALTVASRELLDNLIVVINCNLQRLDGPVRGNGKIIQELESVFQGAGWRVIKLIWGSRWDSLLQKDTQGFLQKRMMEVVDGEYQRYATQDGAYLRKHFFGKYPELLELIADWSDEDLSELNRGGHDIKKVFAAYHAAIQPNANQPTVILAKTIKGYGLGEGNEGYNIVHQQKKMTILQLHHFRDRFDLPISNKSIEQLDYYVPDENSPEIKYLKSHREKLGGYLPERKPLVSSIEVPSLQYFKSFLEGSDGRVISTTMIYVRILQHLLKDKTLGPLIVPIVGDEARTFGMENLFRQIGIYSPIGQQYKPVDAEQLIVYRETQNGQMLQEGISEAGAFSSWMAASTAYYAHHQVLIPFYIYYAMFGMQRIGDLAWAAADAQARGFLLGALAGRTTLAGEGLQHQDGHNLIFYSAIPNCMSYDPAFGYELTVIIQAGLRKMVQDQDNVFYYITLMNENYIHPPMPAGVEEGIVKGMYLLSASLNQDLKTLSVQLLGSGSILPEVMRAADLLRQDFGIVVHIWSVTSFSELRREALAIERDNRLHPTHLAKKSYVTQCLQSVKGPVIAVTDYMRLNAEQIRAFVPHPYVVLGTDGFGRSGTRVQLRHFFEIDQYYIAITALKALLDEGEISINTLTQAMEKYGIDPTKPDPFYL